MKKCLQELIELFELMPEWSDRYNYIIELRERLPEMPAALRVPVNRIECNSQLYFHVCTANDICRIEAFSNTPIPAGIAGLLHMIFNDRSRDEIIEQAMLFNTFLQATKLPEHLTGQRQKAFVSMLTKIAEICSNILP